MRLEIAGPCHVPSASDAASALYAAWLEAALLVRVAVADWDYGEETWAHWTSPVGGDGRTTAAPSRFAPARFAVTPGEPERGPATGSLRLGEKEAREFVATVLAHWHPALHRQPELGLVSRLDEPRDEFRKRCLSLLRPLLLAGTAGRETIAGRLARIAAGIESLPLSVEQITVRHARLGLVWYPEGRAPAVPAAELMVAGAIRGAR